MKVDLPTPGTPEMPSRVALPVDDSSELSSASARMRSSRRVDSSSVIAFARARRSPRRTPSARDGSADDGLTAAA